MSQESSTPAALWWILGVLALAVLGGGIWLAVISARKRAWDTQLVSSRADGRWAATTLAPALVDPTLPLVMLGQQWADGQRRIDAAQVNVLGLSTTAPTEDRRGLARSLSDALVGLREALGAHVALRSQAVGVPSEDAGLQTSARAVERARQSLLTVLGPEPAGAAAGSSGPAGLNEPGA